MTLAYLPELAGSPSTAMTTFFEAYARNVVAAVHIDYTVDRSSNAVSVSHRYVDAFGRPIETLAGMSPQQPT